jgi:hypothetical protein
MSQVSEGTHATYFTEYDPKLCSSRPVHTKRTQGVDNY